jgi:hypothetical protein
VAPKRRWGGGGGYFVNGKESKGTEIGEASKVRIKRLRGGRGMWGGGGRGHKKKVGECRSLKYMQRIYHTAYTTVCLRMTPRGIETY